MWTVDIWEDRVGAYIASAWFISARAARAHWLALTLDGVNAQVTRAA